MEEELEEQEEDIWIKFFSSAPSLSRLLSISIKNLGLMLLLQKNNLPRMKEGAYFIDLDDKKIKGTYWVSLFIDRNTAVYWFLWNWIYSSRSINWSQRESITIYLQLKIMLLLCVDIIIFCFHGIYDCRKYVIRLY